MVFFEARIKLNIKKMQAQLSIPVPAGEGSLNYLMSWFSRAHGIKRLTDPAQLACRLVNNGKRTVIAIAQLHATAKSFQCTFLPRLFRFRAAKPCIFICFAYLAKCMHINISYMPVSYQLWYTNGHAGTYLLFLAWNAMRHARWPAGVQGSFVKLTR